MNNQQFLIDFLIGEISMKAFLQVFLKDISFQTYIDSLLPTEAIDNPAHIIWKKFSYESMKSHGFSISREVFYFCKFDDSPEDNLNVFGPIKYFSSFLFQNLQFTTQYQDDFFFYLDVIQDTFDGPEVRNLVYEILKTSSKITKKSLRIKNAKEQIRTLFHIENNKRPRWIQGPEWPMGSKTPMKYIGRKKEGECISFIFYDVDTGTKKTVEQFY